MKRRAWAIRSTPLRLTAIFLGIFILSSAASFVTAYLVIRANFDSTLEDEIEQTIEAYDAIDDQTALINRLKQDVEVTDAELTILHYVPDVGPVITNVDGFPPVSDFSIISEKVIYAGDEDISESYLANSERVGRGQLIVARTRSQVVEMGEIILSVVLIGLLPAIMLTSAAGVFAARNARRRIGTIQKTLGDLTEGQLAARVPVAANDRDDLTAISAAVNTMATSQEALIESMRQVSADIAHDLKTPIQRVAVILEEVTRKTALSEGQGELLGQALAETDRIVKTFQALLQLAQIEGGAARDRFVPTDLQEVAADVVDFLEADADEKGYHLELTIADGARFLVNGDRHLLTQVLANLIENGLRHTPVGSTIRVELSRNDGQIVLCVSDNGPGIPPEQRDKVWRRLYRLEQSRTTEGNGLGLSLVAAICTLHGAQLSLDDNNPGLLVRVAFPKVDKA
ncbi:HAMP domain-containing sensor histidine kinase [Roseovarius sp. Pro17]|uniref:sensor histidine kinase n=1 Tax=Roseovarius sp. Pro17 TaxID=3108175 RepID=UPI002D770D99|nr:HAMP domain-containing sensor histidine kinase [Roseovarius sp. Pro17]